MGKIDINQSVEALDFGCKYDTRIQRICRDFGITTIRSLCLSTRKELGRINEMGRNSIGTIEGVLGRYGLRLEMAGEELDEYAGIEHGEDENRPALSPRTDPEEARWEQRRYETAKELFVRYRMSALVAVQEAGELIRELKNISQD